MFLFCNGFSWFSRGYRNSFFSSGFMTNICLSPYRQSPRRFGRWYSVLTLCRRSLTIFVCVCLLLRIISPELIINRITVKKVKSLIEEINRIISVFLDRITFIINLFISPFNPVLCSNNNYSVNFNSDDEN